MDQFDEAPPFSDEVSAVRQESLALIEWLRAGISIMGGRLLISPWVNQRLTHDLASDSPFLAIVAQGSLLIAGFNHVKAEPV